MLLNGARDENVFWAVGSSATLGSNVSFQGSVLSVISGSMGANLALVGRLLCSTGSIILVSDNLSLPRL